MSTDRVNPVDVALGLCIIGLGVVLLLMMNGVVAAERVLQLWPLALVVIGGAMLMQAQSGVDTPRRVPVGGVVWLLLISGVFAYAFERRAHATPGVHDGHLSTFGVMSGARPPAFSGEFKGAEVTAVMGGTDIDLRAATLASGASAVVDVFAVMGGFVLRVPPGWRVDIDAATIMGGVRDERPGGARGRDGASDAPTPDTTAPRVVVTGTIVMGGVSIKS